MVFYLDLFVSSSKPVQNRQTNGQITKWLRSNLQTERITSVSYLNRKMTNTWVSTHNNWREAESFKARDCNIQWAEQSAVDPLTHQVMQVHCTTHQLYKSHHHHHRQPWAQCPLVSDAILTIATHRCLSRAAWLNSCRVVPHHCSMSSDHSRWGRPFLFEPSIIPNTRVFIFLLSFILQIWPKRHNFLCITFCSRVSANWINSSAECFQLWADSAPSPWSNTSQRTYHATSQSERTMQTTAPTIQMAQLPKSGRQGTARLPRSLPGFCLVLQTWLTTSHCSDYYYVTSLFRLIVTCPCSLRT